MSQNPSVANCINHCSPNNLVIKDEGTFTLRCCICYSQCIENIRSRHKQLFLTSEIQKPIILNDKSKSFFIEWSQQLIQTLTQAQYSNSPLDYITNFAFILSQHHNLIKTHKEQLNRIFTQVLAQQKQIFKGNIDYVQDLNPTQLTAELFLADLYNMVAQKAEDSLSIILVKFQTFLKYHAHHGLRDWAQKLEKLQFNKNFGRRLIQSKQKTLAMYYKDIFFYVALPPLIQQNKKGYSKVPQIQKSPSIKTESIQSEQQSSNLLKESEVIDRRTIVEDRKPSNEKNITIDIQSPIKKLQTPTQTPKNRIDIQSKESPSAKSQNERTKSKLSTASGKKYELLQTQMHNRIIKEQNQISQDLQSSKNLGNKYPSHSQNITKLSEIINILNVQNKKLKNWKEGVVLQTTNFNKKIGEITGLVQVLREVHKKEKQMPFKDGDDEEKMMNLLIDQYQQLISKHESTLEQLLNQKKQNELIKKQNKTLKLEVQQYSTKIKNLEKLQQQTQLQNIAHLEFPKENIKQLNEKINEYKQKIISLKKENETLKIKNLQQESQIFLKTQRQIEDMAKISHEYSNMVKEKDRMLEEMQQRYKKQIQSIQENMQKKQKQKEQAWHTQKNNLKQKNSEIAKLQDDETEKIKDEKEFHNHDEDLKRENLAMKEELKEQKQKLLQALEVTRELVKLDQLKQRQIDELKEQLIKNQLQIQKISNNLNIAQKLIIELGKEEENYILGPRTLDQVKQAGNQFLAMNPSSKQNENISEIKQGENQFESRIRNLEKKVIQLEQELKVENNSYNDSLIEDLIETESEVKAKQFEINKFINLIEELLAQLPEEKKKKYEQKLHILHL